MENEELLAEVTVSSWLTQSEASLPESRRRQELVKLTVQELEQEQRENRSRAGMDFNRNYPVLWTLRYPEKDNDCLRPGSWRQCQQGF